MNNHREKVIDPNCFYYVQCVCVCGGSVSYPPKVLLLQEKAAQCTASTFEF